MRKRLILILTLLLMLMVPCSSIKAFSLDSEKQEDIIPGPEKLDKGNPQADAQFKYIRMYANQIDVKIDISETGLYTVRYKYDMFFNYNQHGLIIGIPTKYSMNFKDKDGKTYLRKYYWPAKNIKNYSPHDLSVESGDNSAKMLRFGSKYTYVTGPVTYEFSYDIQQHELGLPSGVQSSYFNILGIGVDFPVKKLTFTVNFPKKTDAKAFLYSGFYGNQSAENITYTFDGKTLKGESNRVIPSRYAVTYKVDVEKGYFNFPTRLNLSWATLGLMVFTALMAIITFFRYGKDDPIVVTIEDRPPSDLSSAMVGYIYDNKADNRDVLSLFIEWAAMGYLKLEEDEAHDTIITKLKPISNSHPQFEQNLFNNLFASGDVVNTKSLENKFYRKIESAKTGLTNYFKKNSRRIYNHEASKYQFMTFFFASLFFALLIASLVYFTTYYFPYGLVAVVATFLVAVGYSVLMYGLFNRFSQLKSSKRLLYLLIALFFTASLFGVIFYLFTLLGSFNWMLPLGCGAFLVTILCAINMSKRTPYGVAQLGKIYGLKKFIEEAEKDRLEMLVHDDPKYFYNVLPYAYVLGVSDTWSKKFENIAMPAPEGYESSVPFNPYYYHRDLDYMMRQTTNSFTSRPAPSTGGSGGGGFSGGGFGGGGGGFSGGGFGGGSASGW